MLHYLKHLFEDGLIYFQYLLYNTFHTFHRKSFHIDLHRLNFLLLEINTFQMKKISLYLHDFLKDYLKFLLSLLNNIFHELHRIFFDI